jgi:CheY-like chemotaxis protein
MPEGGRVSVRAENRHISSEEAVNLIAGDYVCIKVRDEGIGISPESLKRIFDPYFTTKPFGNGLGLATSYAVVKAHGGHIQVDSTPGKGSVFQVYLPAIPGEGPIDAPESPVIYDLQARILFMDDDELIREVVHEALIALGHTVDLASSGEEAVRKFQEQARRGAVFDAVIMDLTIKGGMGGQEAITRMRAIDPSIRAIVSSGYSNDPVMGDYKNYGFNHALAKPFTVEELARAITRVLKN